MLTQRGGGLPTNVGSFATFVHYTIMLIYWSLERILILIDLDGRVNFTHEP